MTDREWAWIRGGYVGMFFIPLFTLFFVGNPFDVVKIRLQTQVPGGSQHYTGVVDCVSKILKHEGFFALWKGVTPALSSALLENSVLFSMNGVLKRFYLSTLGDSGGYDGESSRPFTTAESAMLGGAGGFFSSTVSLWRKDLGHSFLNHVSYLWYYSVSPLWKS
jgi:hypothetical protein